MTKLTFLLKLQMKDLASIFNIVGFTHIDIKHAMYGRLVADDGTVENCPYGAPHQNKTDCTASNRSEFFLGRLLSSSKHNLQESPPA